MFPKSLPSSVFGSAAVAVGAAGLIGAAWLNQGVSHARASAAMDSMEDPLHHPLDGARFVLLELYERSGDEEINFAVARATRGLPYDEARLLQRGHDTPAFFDRAPSADGHWHRPYVEVPFEYPIALLPFVLLPSFLGGSTFPLYTRLFGVMTTLMLLGATALALPKSTARELHGEGPSRMWWMLCALLLAQGSLAIERLDAVPALLLAATLWAARSRKRALTGLALGLATATKLFPLLLFPLVVAADPAAWRTRRAGLRGAVVFVVAVLVGFAPMLFPPGPLLDVLHYHSDRGLHVESTGGVLLAFGRLLFTSATRAAGATLSYGSYNLDGPMPDVLAMLATPLMLLLMAAAATRFLRSPPPRDQIERTDRLAFALLAGLAVLWLSAKTFSPQYLTWAIPLVLAVSGAQGKKLRWLLFAILTLTQVYMRAFYGQVIAGTGIGVAFLLVRLPLLVSFLVLALRGASYGVAVSSEVQAVTAA